MNAIDPSAAAFGSFYHSIERIATTTSAGSRTSDGVSSLLQALFDYQPRQTKAESRQTPAEITVDHFGSFLVCRTKTGGGRLLRSQMRLSGDDYDHIIISALISCTAGTLDGQHRKLKAGDVTVLDLSHPSGFLLGPGEAVHLIVPRLYLPVTIAPSHPIPPRILRGDTTMGRFLHGLLATLSSLPPHVHRNEALALASVLPLPLATGIAAVTTPSPMPNKQDNGRRARRYIEDNLHRHDLTPAQLLKELGISRSQLYRQFEKTGGIETYMRRRRLYRSLLKLGEKTASHMRIGDLAYEMGFADEGHFSRLFKKTFGISPRSVRGALDSQLDSATGSAKKLPASAAALTEWLKHLDSGL